MRPSSFFPPLASWVWAAIGGRPRQVSFLAGCGTLDALQGQLAGAIEEATDLLDCPQPVSLDRHDHLLMMPCS